MSKSRYASHIVDSYESLYVNDDGSISLDTLNTACLMDIAKSARRIRVALEGIEANIRSLGRDGIHNAIRHASKVACRAEKRERARRRASRLAR